MRPSSIQEAVSIIQKKFPAKQLENFASQPESIACVQAHFDLGMWIRNNWFYGSGSPLAKKMLEIDWTLDADQMSSLIIKSLWQVLNGQPCPTINELVNRA